MRVWTSWTRRSRTLAGEDVKHYRSSDQWEQGLGYLKRKMPLDGVLPHQVDLLQEVRFSAGATIPMHYHQVQTEIFFVLAPGSITIDGTVIDAQAGDVIVCEPGEVHGMPRVQKDFAFLVMKIDYRDGDTVWL
jgi:quercetin dioxygenase-like cupin family protein